MFNIKKTSNKNKNVQLNNECFKLCNLKRFLSSVKML